MSNHSFSQWLMRGFLLIMLFAGSFAAPVYSSGISSILGNLEMESDEPLDPAIAFAFNGLNYNGEKLTASWEVAPKYYVYRKKFQINVLSPDIFEASPLETPKGKIKQDETLGEIEALYKHVEIHLPVKRLNQNETEVIVEVVWQGCAEEIGLCYPAEEHAYKATLPAAQNSTNNILFEEIDYDSVKELKAAATPAPKTNAEDKEEFESAVVISEQDEIANKLASGNVIVTLLSFFVFGLFLSLTPCIFPMIPILSGIIVGQKDISTRQAFTLSLVYVLAMALTYTAVGVLAGLFGSNLQAAFQNPWIIGTFSAIFVLLALSMFGFYELQMPSAIQSRLNELSNKQSGGSLIGVAIMGVLSALIVGPCVAAPLAGALIYIGQTGDAVLGGMALFTLSIGMGIPLLAIGTSAGTFMPKAGTWMEAIKAIFGVLLLGVAIWMLERILPTQITLLLWAILLIVSSIYMGALRQLPFGSSGWLSLWKGFGIVFLIYGALLMIGSATGKGSVLQPLKGISGNASAHTSQAAHKEFARVRNLDELNKAIEQNKGKTVMLDFYADWCISCIEMENFTFPAPNVQTALKDVVLLQADVTANNKDDKALMKHFGIFGPPAIMFFDKNGQEQKGLRVVGFMEAEKFATHVNKAK